MNKTLIVDNVDFKTLLSQARGVHKILWVALDKKLITPKEYERLAQVTDMITDACLDELNDD